MCPFRGFLRYTGITMHADCVQVWFWRSAIRIEQPSMQSKSIIAGNRHRLFGLREPFSCFLCLTLLKFFDTLRRNQRLMENGTFPLRIDAEMEQVFRSRIQRCDTGSRHGSRGDANVANDCVIVMLHCCLVSLRLTDCSQLLSIVRAYGVFVGFDRFFHF